jgi:hypothetical protein
VSVRAVVVRIVSGVPFGRDHRGQTLNNPFGAVLCSVVRALLRPLYPAFLRLGQ